MKDKMSGSHWHYSRCHGVDERQGEWVRSIALVQQLTDFMESMKDSVGGFSPLHWHHSKLHGVDERQGEWFHSIALAPQQTSWS